MKHIALRLQAVIRQERGSAEIVLPVFVLAAVIVGLAYRSAHQTVPVSALLIQLQQIPHFWAFVAAALIVAFFLVVSVCPGVLRLAYLVAIAGGSYGALKFVAIAPFLAQVHQITGHGG